MFWKDKIDHNKIIMSTKNNLIIVIVGAKQCGAQIIYLFIYLFISWSYLCFSK